MRIVLNRVLFVYVLPALHLHSEENPVHRSCHFLILQQKLHRVCIPLRYAYCPTKHLQMIWIFYAPERRNIIHETFYKYVWSKRSAMNLMEGSDGKVFLLDFIWIYRNLSETVNTVNVQDVNIITQWICSFPHIVHYLNTLTNHLTPHERRCKYVYSKVFEIFREILRNALTILLNLWTVNVFHSLHSRFTTKYEVRIITQ